MAPADCNRPLVSIALPVRNGDATLRTAVRSVLWQTYNNWELLLIDDGSSDSTPCIAASFRDDRIRVIRDGQHLGLPARLNQAIELSRGEYIARMDADDVAYPARVERQVRYLESRPEVSLVGAAAIVFDANGKAVGKRVFPEDHESICRRPWRGFGLVHPTWLGRTAFFRTYRYRDRAVRCEDQDLLLRASGALGRTLSASRGEAPRYPAHDECRFGNVPEILLGYRETELKFKKQLVARRYKALAFCTEFVAKDHYLWAARCLIGEALRLGVEAAAIASGLRYRLLRHRAREATRAEANCWNQLWASLQEEA